MCPTLKSTGVDHFVAKFGNQAVDRCKPYFNTIWERQALAAKEIEIVSISSAVWTQCTNVTDRQTDHGTIPIGEIPISDVAYKGITSKHASLLKSNPIEKKLWKLNYITLLLLPVTVIYVCQLYLFLRVSVWVIPLKSSYPPYLLSLATVCYLCSYTETWFDLNGFDAEPCGYVDDESCEVKSQTVAVAFIEHITQVKTSRWVFHGICRYFVTTQVEYLHRLNILLTRSHNSSIQV